MFSKIMTRKSTESYSDNISKLKDAITSSDAIIIGAGAGLSTAAGYTYSGERFKKYFGDFAERFGIRDIYSGGFYPFPSAEIKWAWWSRHVWVNRYAPAPKPVYEELFELVKDKDYYVISTNVDSAFINAGFDVSRLFYTQGDYGLFQCTKPCHYETYDNKEVIRKMIEDQGFIIEDDGNLTIPPEGVRMEVSTDLIPYCPKCGSPMDINLRCDDTFVEDEHWHVAAGSYGNFLARHGIKAMGFFTEDTTEKVDKGYDGKVLLMEFGIGMNTPGIIKYPFWQYTSQNKNVTYSCINMGEAYAPSDIEDRSICVDGDIAEIIKEL
ncbi:Sir2 silent information regulator family NAD-dependent deacetylase [Butyrivibrio sp. INlla16]|uniref:SIR2 family NAD-dependent protein deacylase n=1 Tax=Butyrivibrio sp. INlla16 TaxID=1520807 RepID=UPI000884DBB4|nr:Sir2 silent information regulator family NAD-dependent deacetylase [Butyrivibrio sp. INlla16]SDB50273.1 hypothetical protein SAMN02910263_02516 [Butyrivibrio sp. INlla16]